MKNLWMKISSTFLAVLICVACGKENNKQDNANIPQPRGQNHCINSGGNGCSWNTYPPGFQAYPTNNGYYNGYSPYSGYTNFNACPYGSYPIYDVNFGLACVSIPNYSAYSWYMWGGQQQYANTNYGYLLYCTPGMPGSCMQGSCVPLNQINNPGYGWNNPQYGGSGICQ